jgi:hypothetical protein
MVFYAVLLAMPQKILADCNDTRHPMKISFGETVVTLTTSRVLRFFRLTGLAATLVLLTSFGGDSRFSNGFFIAAANASATRQSSQHARYRLTLKSTWSAETHSLNFPPDPHYSDLIGAVHNAQVRFWELDTMASPGIQLMAERGRSKAMLEHINEATEAGFVLSLIVGEGVKLSPGTTSTEFDVSRDYPEITVTTMLAPSPDWFVGVHNYSLIQDGNFIESATIELVLYDSGSDNGALYISRNDKADPLLPISRLSSKPEDTPFVDGMPPVGVFILERLSME